jgi:hypothetical protein
LSPSANLPSPQRNKATGKEAIETLATYDWTEKKANISSKAIEELPPYWTLNTAAPNAGSAANKSNPRKFVFNVAGTEMQVDGAADVYKSEGSTELVYCKLLT